MVVRGSSEAHLRSAITKIKKRKGNMEVWVSTRERKKKGECESVSVPAGSETREAAQGTADSKMTAFFPWDAKQSACGELTRLS